MNKLTKEQAWDLLAAYTETPALQRHALQVAAAMEHFARLAGEDPEVWWAAGLLHALQEKVQGQSVRRRGQPGGDPQGVRDAGRSPGRDHPGDHRGDERARRRDRPGRRRRSLTAPPERNTPHETTRTPAACFFPGGDAREVGGKIRQALFPAACAELDAADQFHGALLSGQKARRRPLTGPAAHGMQGKVSPRSPLLRFRWPAR